MKDFLYQSFEMFIKGDIIKAIIASFIWCQVKPFFEKEVDLTIKTKKCGTVVFMSIVLLINNPIEIGNITNKTDEKSSLIYNCEVNKNQDIEKEIILFYDKNIEKVMIIRHKLFILNYLSKSEGGVDFEFINAVKLFQEVNGLKVDGKVGEKTQEKLFRTWKVGN